MRKEEEDVPIEASKKWLMEGRKNWRRRYQRKYTTKVRRRGIQYTRNISTIDEKSCGKEIVEVEVLNQSME